MKKGTWKYLWIFAGGLVLLLLIFIGLLIYVATENNKLRTYEFTAENLNIPQDDLIMTITVSKQWQDRDLHPNEPLGAEYDGILTNNSNVVFKDWYVRMVYSENSVLDSSWNGDYTIKDNIITFVAKNESATVAPQSQATFGAVINSKNLLELQSYTLQGYRIMKVSQLLTAKILLVLTILWIMAALMNITVSLKTRQYKARQELDMAIINQSISTFTGFIDAKDTYTRGHSSRVAEYAAEIARRDKLDEEEVQRVYQIGLMHDCGKIGIPDNVLKKPGPLTKEEYETIKSHTTLGDELLANFTAIPGIRDGAHYHHERYDGNGYPARLAGKSIPLYARIICIADSFDAMSSNRCYREHLEDEEIRRELTDNAGKQFDPELVLLMLEMMDDGFVTAVRAD